MRGYGGNNRRGYEKWGPNERRVLKTRDKMMKRTACHRRAWVGCGRSKREGKKEWDLASHFVDRLNKSIKARWSTLIELHKWDWGGYTWQSCYKAATGVGRPRLQALSEINHPCWPLLAFLLSPHLSFCFSGLVCLFNSSSHPALIVLFFLSLSFSIAHCNALKLDPVSVHFCLSYMLFGQNKTRSVYGFVSINILWKIRHVLIWCFLLVCSYRTGIGNLQGSVSG